MNSIQPLSLIHFLPLNRFVAWVHVMIWCLLLALGTQADPIGSPTRYTVAPGTLVGIVDLDGNPVQAGAVIGFYQGSELRGIFEITSTQIIDGKSYFNAVIQYSGQSETLTKAVLWIPQSGILYDLNLDIPMPLAASYADYDQIQTFSFSQVLFDQDIIATLSVGIVDDLIVQEDQQLLIDASLLWGELVVEPYVDDLFVNGQGGLSWNQEDQQLSYQPPKDFYGTEWVFVPVPANTGLASVYAKVTVESVNDAPVVQAATVSLHEDEGRAFTVQASDVEGDALAFEILSYPSHGVLSGTPPVLSYQPNVNYHGTDAMVIKANDGEDDSTETTIDFTIQSVNDAPVGVQQNPVVLEDETVTITLTGNDAEGDSLIYEIQKAPEHGTLLGQAPDLEYLPDQDHAGSDFFTYSVFDGQDYSQEVTVNITIVAVNDQAVISLTNPAVTHEAGQIYVDQGAKATDIEDNDSILTGAILIGGDLVDSNTAPGVYEITYDVTDSDGLSAAQVVRTVTVVDTTNPVLTVAELSPYVVEAGSVFVTPEAMATDFVDGDLTSEIKVTVNVDTQIPGDMYYVNYEVTDTSGNNTSSTLMVTVADTTNPVLTVAELSPYVVEAGSVFMVPEAMATDIVDGDLTSEIKVTVNVDTQIPGDMYYVNYEVTDTSGNNTSSTLMVTVADTTNPVLTVAELSPYVVEAGSVFVAPEAMATDIVDGDLTSKIKVTVNVDTQIPGGMHYVNYEVTDTDGNVSNRTLPVKVVDSMPPQITLNGQEVVIIDLGTRFKDPGAIAVDALDGQVSVFADSDFFPSRYGQYTITYRSVDAAGNVSTANRYIHTHVKAGGDYMGMDLFGAELSGTDLKGARFLGSYLSGADLSASDLRESNLAYAFLSGADLTNANLSQANLTGAKLTKVNLDGASLEGAKLDMALGSGILGIPLTMPFGYKLINGEIVAMDLTSPDIILTEVSPYKWEAGQTFVVPGASADDPEDGDLTAAIETTIDVDVMVPAETYSVVYNVVDGGGNAATQTLVVHVVDTTAPVIQLKGDSVITIEAGTLYQDQGALAYDLIDPEVQVISSGDVNSKSVGSYAIIYNAADQYGNSAGEVTRIVVVEDKTAPVVSLVGDASVSIPFGTAYIDPGASVTDNTDESITIEVISTVDSFNPGTYTITYKAEDSSGNVGSIQRQLTVQDPAKTLVFSLPDLLDVEPLTKGLQVPITLTGFDESGSFQVALLWDPEVVKLVGFDPQSIPALNEEDQLLDSQLTGITLFEDSNTPGRAMISWTSPDQTDISLPDGSEIVLLFDVIGTAGDVSSLTFDQTSSAVTSFSDTAPTLEFIDGTLSVKIGGYPKLELVGEAELTIEAGIAYQDEGAIATDDEDESVALTAKIISVNPVDVSQIGNYLVTYNVVDSWGQTANEITRSVKVADTTAPVINLIGDSVITVNVGADFVDPGYSVTDFEQNLKVLVVGFINTARAGTYSLYYRAQDSSGNKAEPKVRTITVKDSVPPLVTLKGADTISIGLGESFFDPGAVGIDRQDGQVQVVVSGAVDNQRVGYYTLTYVATDSAGNQSTAVTRAVIVRDTVPPTLTLKGSPAVSITLGDVYEDPGYEVSDNVDLEVEVTVNENVDESSEGDYVWTYIAEDDFGNKAIATRYVSVRAPGDYIPPTIALNGDKVIRLGLGSPYVEAGATVTDNLDISSAAEPKGEVNTAKPGYYTIVYTAQDAAGNEASPVTRLVIVEDDQAPVMSLNGPKNIYVEVGDTYEDPGAEAVDGVDGRVEVVLSGTVNTGILGAYTIDFNASDKSGNKTEAHRTVIVRDTQRPVIALKDSPIVQVLSGSSYVDAGAQVTDNYDFGLSATTTDVIETNQLGIQLLRYTAVDSSGNKAIPVTRIVRVVADAPPVITLNGEKDVILNLGNTYDDPGATAEDDQDLDVQVVVFGMVDTSKPGNYFITYTAVDGGGKVATPVVRTVTVKDNIPPLISLTGSRLMIVEVGQTYVEPGYSATDETDGDLTTQVIVKDDLDLDSPGFYTVVYSVKDATGNRASAVRGVQVTLPKDTQAPVINLEGARNFLLTVGENFEDPGVFVTDNVDDDLQPEVQGIVDPSVAGVYILTYTARDNAGNYAVPEYRFVIVSHPKDTDPPVIELLGNNPSVVTQGETFTDPGAIVTDDTDINLSYQVLGAVNTSIVNTYVLTYTARDSAGNTAKPETRVVRVQEPKDNYPPIITLNGDELIEIPVDSFYEDPGAVAEDAVDGIVNVDAVTDLDITIAGVYNVTYTAKDSAGNAAEAVSRVVIVAESNDTVPPVISLEGDPYIELTIGSTYDDAGATALDNLDGDLTSSLISRGFDTLNLNQVGFYAITYVVKDSSGNAAEPSTRVIRVKPVSGAKKLTNIPRQFSRAGGSPDITLQGLSNVNHPVNTAYTDAGAIAEDTGSDPDPSVTVTPVGLEEIDTASVGTYTIIYIAEDSDGNNAIPVVRTVNVVDTVAPVMFLEEGTSAITLDVGDTYNDQPPTASDNYDASVQVQTLGAEKLDTTVLGTYTLTYMVQDMSGNQAQPMPRTITVVDNDAPVITLTGDAAINHELGEAFVDPGYTVADNYDPSVTVNVSGEVNGLIQGIYTLTYEAVDSSGNLALLTRTVSVNDFVEPVITLLGDANTIHPVNSSYTDAGANALDAGEGIVNVVSSGIVNTGVVGNYTLTFTATDSSGNQAIATRSVRVADLVAPEITLNGDAQINHQIGETYVDAGAILSDNYDDDVSLVPSGSVNVDTAGNYTLAFVASDSSNNQAAAVTRTIEVADFIAPVITLKGASIITHQLNSDYVDPGTEVSDNIDTDLVAAVAGNVDTSQSGIYVLQFSVTDSSGNAAQIVTRTVTVADSAPPIITLMGDTVINLSQGTPYSEPGISATDGEEGVVDVVTMGEVDHTVAGIYTLTYTAADSQGNEADPLIRTVIVQIDDVAPPIITLEEPLSMTLNLGEAFADPGYAATDTVDGPVDVMVSGVVTTTALGSYTLTYTARDSAGNDAEPKTRLVKVVSTDSIIPVITLEGNANIDHSLGDDYVDEGASATDNVDQEVEVVAVGLQDVDVDTPGIYTVTYTATDSAGNQATPLTRTINVADLTPPVITLNGNAFIELDLDASYNDAGVTVTDNVDANPSKATTGLVDTSKPGNYTLTYTASDAAGNQAVPVTRTVVVLGADVSAPVINLRGDAVINIELGDSYNELGADVLDDMDQDLAVVISGVVQDDTLGVYTVTYTATDSAGNQAIPVTRTVFIVDIDEPSLILNGNSYVVHESGDPYEDPGAIAQDAIEGVLSPTLTGSVDVYKPGVYVLTYTARDSSGNQAVPVNRTVTVVDTTAPVIVLTGQSRLAIERGSAFIEPGFTVLDAEAGLQVNVTGSVDSSIVGTYTLNYSVTDSSGNVAVPTTRTVVVEDTTAPVITLEGHARVIVEAGDTYIDAGATALDAVDGSLAVSASGEVNTSKPGTYSIIYFATDFSGNQADTVSRVIQVIDTKAPVITLSGPANIIHQLGDLYSDAGATASDIVDASVFITTSGSVDVTAVGTYTLTYSAVDAAGNQAAAITREVQVKSFSENLGLLSFATNADGTGVELTRCDLTASGRLEIPAQFAGLTVKAIGERAFENCVGLKTILIPDTVHSIADGAFAGCSQIQEISVPGSVESLGKGIFARCSLLASIFFDGDAPSLPQSGLLADVTSPAVVYVDAYADGFEFTYGGLEVSRPDVIAPVLVLQGNPEISHEALTPYEDAGAIAIDESDFEVFVVVEGTVDTSIPGTYKLTYLAADQSGNQATSLTRLVHVRDTVAPVVSLVGEYDSAHPLNKPFVDPGAVASDLVDGDLDVMVSGTVDVNVPGNYELVYSAIDGSGNIAQVTRVVTVGDGLTLHSIIATQPVVAENGGATQIIVYLTETTTERAFLYLEASPLNHVRLSNRILSVPAGSGVVSFSVTAIDDAVPNGDQAVSVSIKSLYRELGRIDLIIKDDEVTNYGIVSDGLVSGAAVFFDINGNGQKDDEEPGTTTDKLGAYRLDLPVRQYDQNGDGSVDSKDGIIVAVGGLDTATGLPLNHPLMAPPTASVVNPLTTLVSGLLASDGELNEAQASEKVGAALKLDSAVNLLSYDMINEASKGSSTAVEVIQAAAAVQDTLVQVASAIGVSARTGSEVVTAAIIERIYEGQPLELDNPVAVSELVDASAQKAQRTVPQTLRDAASAIIASANQLKTSAVASSTTSAEAALAISKVQVVAQSVVSKDLVSAAAGTSSISSVASKYDQASIQQLVDETVAGPLSGLDVRPGSFEFSGATYTFDESGKGKRPLKVLRRDGNLGPVTIEVLVSAGTATAGEDFKTATLLVEFGDQEISQTLAMSDLLIDDSINESSEFITLAIRLPEGTPSAVKLGEQTSVVVQILDNETAGSFQFATDSLQIGEGDGEAAIVVERLGGSKGVVSLNVAVKPTGEAIQGQDFVLVTRELSFGDGDVRGLVLLNVIEDQLVEENESLKLVLSLVDGSGAALGESSMITVTLVSNDKKQAPLISVIEDQTMRLGEILEAIEFNVTGGQTGSNELAIGVGSDNPDLIPEANILVRPSPVAGQYSLRILPWAQKSGVANITISVTDGEFVSQALFQLVVLEANDPPTITAIPERINAVGRDVVIPFIIGDSDDEASSLLVYLETQETRYLTQGDLLIVDQGGGQRQLIINRTEKAKGIGRFKLVVVDGDGASVSSDFLVDFSLEQSTPALNLQVVDDTNIALVWEGNYRLYYSQSIDEPFQEVLDAGSPYVAPMNKQGFYKLMP